MEEIFGKKTILAGGLVLDGWGRCLWANKIKEIGYPSPMLGAKTYH